jgi:peroxiredoxin
MTTSQPPRDLEDAIADVREMDVSLAEQLDVLAASTRARRPEFADAIERLVARLKESDAGAAAPAIGDPMPPFCLPDDAGRLVSLDDLLAEGPIAIVFHRGHWCPFCRTSINALVRAHEEVSSEGGQIVAVMPDRQQFTNKLKSDAKVPFKILTDIDNGFALSLNLAIWIGEEMKNAMRQSLPTFQGNDSWMLPIPATFVVGPDGKINARFVDPDFRKRMAIKDLLRALRSSIQTA